MQKFLIAGIKNYTSIIMAALLSLIIFYLSVIQAEAAIDHQPVEDFTGYLEQRVPALMKDYKIPGLAIVLIHDYEIVWLKAYGYADLDEERLMTTDTYCRVQSISKSVTAWGVMKLAEKDLIDLDQPATNYLHSWEFPDKTYPPEEITIRRLLSMNAGLPLGTVDVIYSPEDNIPSLRDRLTEEAFLIKEPGSGFYYSNVSFNLLELLIEDVSSRDFAEFMESEILKPLGMNQSTYTWQNTLYPPVPTGYDLNGKPIPVYVYPEKGSGGLFASVEDVASFAIAGMKENNSIKQGVLKPETIKQLYNPEVEIIGFYSLAFDAYGLGHFIEILPDGNFTVSHGGQGSGIMTHFQSFPDSGEGIVILTNSQRSWPVFAYILRDWGNWLGYPSLGMSIIIMGQTLLYLLISLVLLIVIWQLWILICGMLSGNRRFMPLSHNGLVLRIIKLFLAVILTSLFIWSVNQSYLFITSVFPKATGWLALTIIMSAITLYLYALFPFIGTQRRNQR